MTTNTTSVPRQPSQATRDKAQRLDILMLTRTMAIVAGDHDDYIIWRDTLECSCKAGQAGIVCSHRLVVEAARQTPPPKVTPRAYPLYDRTTGCFAVVVNGKVVDYCRTLLEAEARIKQLVEASRG